MLFDDTLGTKPALSWVRQWRNSVMGYRKIGSIVPIKIA